MALSAHALTLYATVRDAMGFTSADDATVQTKIERIINAVSDEMESLAHRHFEYGAAISEKQKGFDEPRLVLERAPLKAITSIEYLGVDGTTVSTLDSDSYETLVPFNDGNDVGLGNQDRLLVLLLPDDRFLVLLLDQYWFLELHFLRFQNWKVKGFLNISRSLNHALRISDVFLGDRQPALFALFLNSHGDLLLSPTYNFENFCRDIALGIDDERGTPRVVNPFFHASCPWAGGKINTATLSGLPTQLDAVGLPRFESKGNCVRGKRVAVLRIG